MKTLTPADIQAKVKTVHFHVMPSGKTTICEIITKNGFSHIGTSHVLDISKFNKDRGEETAYANAFDKVWEAEAYLASEQAFKEIWKDDE